MFSYVKYGMPETFIGKHCLTEVLERLCYWLQALTLTVMACPEISASSGGSDGEASMHFCMCWDCR